MEIYTKLINKEVEEALLGDLNTLWEVVSGLEGDEEFEEELDRIKFGFITKFDIRSIVEEEYEKKPAFREVWIERKLHINITEFRDEIDDRKTAMKNILRNCYDDSFDSQHEEDIKGYEDG